MKANDIIVCTWGYEARLATFYRVLKVLPKSLRIVELKNIRNTGDWYDGTACPVGEDVHGRQFTVRLRPDSPYVKTDHGLAYLWNGEPVHTYNHH